MLRKIEVLTVGLIGWLGWMVTTVPAEVVLVQDGEARAAVVLPDDPAEAEQQAADELVEHIALISGATLPVTTAGDAPDGLLPIRIGAAADAALDTLAREQRDDPFAFALVAEDGAVQLRGLSPAGTRTAAYELLEQLGVRWYMPGDIGRVIPRKTTVSLSAQRTAQAPAFIGRRAARNHASTWNHRLRMGGRGRYGSHGIRPFHPSRAARALFVEDPGLFALIGDERRPRQLCLTYSTDDVSENRTLQMAVEHYRNHLRENPETTLLNMGPNDGSGYCECSHCRALDPPEHMTTPLATPEPSFTDRYVWFFNRMTEALRDEFPDVRIGFYAYAQHLMPPVAVESMDNLAISLAPIHVCRIHGPNNPVCPESNFPAWAYEQWRPYAGEYMADRGYLFNLADPGFPFSMVHRVREEIPIFYDLGVRIWAAGPADAWASHNPSMYLTAKLLWDPTLDVDALLEEFYRLFYGPAAEPMAAWHQFMDQTLRDADYHSGSVWDIPHIYPDTVRSEARSLLDTAARLAEDADDPVYATRVAIKIAALDFLDAYCEQRARRDDFDFVGAREWMEKARAARDRLLEDFEYPMLMPRHADSLFRRFVERSAAQNYESTGGTAATLVARFDPVWKFQIDPERWGRFIGLHRPESRGGNWQTIRTDSTWSNQGLRYYFGQAWYRQTVDVSAGFEDQPVHIWFSGVDNTAEVWVNGVFVGANHGGEEFDLDAFGSSFRPFQFDASTAIRHGEPNVVTVRAMRPRTNELGTGGIMGPVMFYLPGDE